MSEYLSYLSAAFYWDIPYIENLWDPEDYDCSKYYVTVSQESERYFKKNRICNISKLALPANAVVSRNGEMVASPELMFLQIASKWDIHRLILLGLQLCSHPPGNPSKAITTKRKLRAFLAKTAGHRGQRKALRALEYLENGSASVMESLVFMIFTLPNIFGGYGLDGAVFNHEIILKGEANKRLRQNRCFADLFYESAKLAVEYESFAFHNSPAGQGKDLLRAATLERQSIDVIHLSTIQLYDSEACLDFARNLATRLGKRIRIRADKFEQNHRLLRALLPKGIEKEKILSNKE